MSDADIEKLADRLPAHEAQPSEGGMAKRTLDEWMTAVAKLAGYSDRDAMLADTGEECWRGYYDDDYTPAEAWAEECSYD